MPEQQTNSGRWVMLAEFTAATAQPPSEVERRVAAGEITVARDGTRVRYLLEPKHLVQR